MRVPGSRPPSTRPATGRGDKPWWYIWTSQCSPFCVQAATAEEAAQIAMDRHVRNASELHVVAASDVRDFKLETSLVAIT